MSKYRRLRQWLLESGVLRPEDLAVPTAATDAQLLRVHDPAYLEQVVTGTLERKVQRRVGFPWSPELVERSRRSVGGTLAAAAAALEDGVGANLAGGTHHAFADRGEGFCVFNDVAVAVRDLQAEGRVRRAVVVDCDVHQGNGTAAIFRGDSSVFTLSIHGAKNYPFHKEDGDFDVALPDGTGDAAYLEELGTALDAVLAWVEPQDEQRPEPSAAPADLGPASSANPRNSVSSTVAFYVSGADPYVGDRLGRLSVSAEGLARRDQLVFSRLRGAGLPVAVVMAGGYAEPVEDIVRIHGATLAEATRWTGNPATGTSLAR